MHTPFDDFVEMLVARKYHNHRQQEHSDIVSNGIFNDLLHSCSELRQDYENNVVGKWNNFVTDASRQGRGRRIDLLVSGYKPNSKSPDLTQTRIAIENKSVITAHRNRTNRYSDLNEDLNVIHANSPVAVHVATVLIGTANRFLNVADRVKMLCKREPNKFETKVLPRLSSGDQSLWNEYDIAVSQNKKDDDIKSIERFRTLPTRSPGHTHEHGYDYILLVPMFVDNVNKPYVDRKNKHGIDVDAEYEKMLRIICSAYKARWHLER